MEGRLGAAEHGLKQPIADRPAQVRAHLLDCHLRIVLGPDDYGYDPRGPPSSP